MLQPWLPLWAFQSYRWPQRLHWRQPCKWRAHSAQNGQASSRGAIAQSSHIFATAPTVRGCAGSAPADPIDVRSCRDVWRSAAPCTGVGDRFVLTMLSALVLG